MKSNLARAAIAALAFGCAGVAQALPIYFEFSGIVTQPSSAVGVGTAVSGRFNLETDRLLFSGPSGGIQYSFVDWEPTDLTGPLAYVDFAGTHHEVPAYSSSYAILNFADGCQPVCNTGWSENFNLGASTQDAWSQGYTGQLRSSNISLVNAYTLPGFPPQGYDAFEGATATPLDTLSLPLASLSGSYYESIAECVDGACAETSHDYFVFRIDTLTRGVVQTSVPEPGTLGLWATAMLLGVATRRRARSKSSPVC